MNEELVREKIAAVIDSPEQDFIYIIYDNGDMPDQHQLSQIVVRFAKLVDELREAIG